MFKPPKRCLRSTKALNGGEPELDEPFSADETHSQLKDSKKSKLFKSPKRQTCVESNTESESANKLSLKNDTSSGQEVMHKEGYKDSQLQNDEHNVTLYSTARKRGRLRASPLNENNKCGIQDNKKQKLKRFIKQNVESLSNEVTSNDTVSVNSLVISSDVMPQTLQDGIINNEVTKKFGKGCRVGIGAGGGNKVKPFVAPKRLRREVVNGAEEQMHSAQRFVNTAEIGDNINVTDNKKNRMLQACRMNETIESVIRSSKCPPSKSDEGCRDDATKLSEPPTPSISNTPNAFSSVAVYTPAGQKYVINNTQKDRPSHFKVTRDEFQWDGSVFTNVRRLKYDLKAGDFCPTTLDSSVEKKCKDFLNAVSVAGAKCYDQETDTRKMLLKKFYEQENKLLHFNKLVLTDLAGSFNEVLKKLMMLFSLNLHPVMLKKNPEVVQTVQKLAAQNRYPKLKHVATKFLDRIKMILVIPKDETFQKHFARMVNAFEQSTAHLTPAEKFFVPGFPNS